MSVAKEELAISSWLRQKVKNKFNAIAMTNTSSSRIFIAGFFLVNFSYIWFIILLVVLSSSSFGILSIFIAFIVWPANGPTKLWLILCYQQKPTRNSWCWCWWWAAKWWFVTEYFSYFLLFWNVFEAEAFIFIALATTVLLPTKKQESRVFQICSPQLIIFQSASSSIVLAPISCKPSAA